MAAESQSVPSTQARLKAEREERKRLRRERWQQLQPKRDQEEQLREKLKSHSKNWTTGSCKAFGTAKHLRSRTPSGQQTCKRIEMR